MTFSDLIAGTIPNHGKYSSRNGQTIARVIQHHHAATSDGGTRRLTDPSAPASVTYNILNDGSIWGQVPEEFRPWTSGSFEADAPAITFEVQNEGGQINDDDNDPGSWAISEAAYAAVVALLADIAVRHGWGAVSEGNYQGHRQWFATSCPGGNLWSLMDNTRGFANGYMGGDIQLAPVPKTPPVEGKTIWQLADEVMAGLHGSGADRQSSLGSNYDAVQAEVNRRFGVGVVASAPKSIAQLADEVLAGAHGNGDERAASLGENYAAVQAEINRRLGGGGIAPSGVNISQLADGVLRGDYGSGQDRVNALGVHFDEVQAEVNRRLGGGVSPVTAANNIGALVDATIRGEYGDGDDRIRNLGSNYAAVQDEINRRFA